MQGIFVGAAAFVVFTIIGPEYDYSCFVGLFTMLQETCVGLRVEGFEKDGVKEEYLRAPKDVIEFNSDEDIEFEKVSIKHIK